MAQLISQIRPGIVQILIFFAINTTVSIGSDDNQQPVETYNVELVKKEMEPLELSDSCSYSAQILSYFSYYDLDFDVNHCFGTFESQDFTLAAHVIVPDSAKGMVFLLHGYYDHAGVLKNVIKLCIEKKLTVAVFDFPGHGLSTGTKALIDSFSQYIKAFKDFFTFCKQYIEEPYYLIGHSMGGAIAFEYLYRIEDQPFKRVVLLAPLVRISYHHLSRIGYFIMNPFSDTAPRWFRRASSDKQFLKFFRNDPLQCKHFPIKWAEAYYEWNKRIQSYESISAPVTVIQGARDDVVNWRHNIPFLKKKIPDLKVIYIKEARHQLMNEAEPFLNEFLEALGKQIGPE